MSFEIKFDLSSRDGPFLAKRDTIAGEVLELHIEGRNHGWWCTTSGVRRFEASSEQVETAKREYWADNTAS